MTKPRANKFLTARKLRISSKCRDGLIRLEADLRSGKIKHVKSNLYAHVHPSSRKYGKRFNMAVWGSLDCGTVHCIGGFLDAWGALSVTDHDRLRALFLPLPPRG